MNILITGVGGPTVRSITKSIRMSDKLGQLTIIGVDANPYCHGLYEKGMYIVSCELNGAVYTQKIIVN